MRWAFWRSKERPDPAAEPALPSEVGLPAPSRPPGPSRPPAAPARDRDDDPQAGPGASPFSGASPDPGQRGDRRPGDGRSPDHASPPAIPVDVEPPGRDALQQSAETVVATVRAVLAGDRAAVEAAVARSAATAAGARAASTLATGGLAARLPALSGITGEVVFDEPQDDLLHAYADLLSERAEPLRRRTAPELRDTVARVAHHAATAAHERHQGHPSADVGQMLDLPDVAPQEQLVAACVLLAQTTRDGGAGTDALATGLRDLATELAGPTDTGPPG